MKKEKNEKKKNIIFFCYLMKRLEIEYLYSFFFFFFFGLKIFKKYFKKKIFKK